MLALSCHTANRINDYVIHACFKRSNHTCKTLYRIFTTPTMTAIHFNILRATFLRIATMPLIVMLTLYTPISSVPTWTTTIRLQQLSSVHPRQMDVRRDALGRQEIRVGVLAPAGRASRALFSLDRIMPALRQAVDGELVQRALPGCFLTLLGDDSNCDAIKAPINAFEFYWRHKVTI